MLYNVSKRLYGDLLYQDTIQWKYIQFSSVIYYLFNKWHFSKIKIINDPNPHKKTVAFSDCGESGVQESHDPKLWKQPHVTNVHKTIAIAKSNPSDID
jgi:hypothetical protein